MYTGQVIMLVSAVIGFCFGYRRTIAKPNERTYAESTTRLADKI